MTPAEYGKKTKKFSGKALHSDEIDHLCGAAMHHPSVFEAVTTHVTGQLVKASYAGGEKTALVLAALRRVASAGGPGSAAFWARVTNATKELLFAEEADDEERETILGWLDDVKAEGKDHYAEAAALEQFPRYWMGLQLSVLRSALATFASIPSAAELAAIAERAASVSSPAMTSRLSDLRTAFDERMQKHWGRQLLGLRSGIAELDGRTDGLRGLTLFGAKPGSGKTTKSIEIALGIARHVEENDAAVVLVSADMPRETLYARMLCNLGGIEYARLAKGSPQGEKRTKGWKHHSAADAQKILAARSALDKLQDRLFIYGSDNGQPITAASLKGYVAEAKRVTKLSRAFLVVDYLQLLAVPEGLDELAADRHRVAELQRVIEASRKQGDDAAAVLAISEMRKPVGERKGSEWGTGIEDLMGTARLGYAADAALLCRAMTPGEMAAYYPDFGDKKAKEIEMHAEKTLAGLSATGITPVTFALAKGRDGMKRGKWSEEFHYNLSQFKTMKPGQKVLPVDGA